MIAKLLAIAAMVLVCLTATARADDLLIRNVRLIDLTAETPRWSAPQSVLVTGDRIAAIGPDITTPDGTKVIDGKGGYLLPGLTDMHVHVWDRAALGAYLAHGVTTVRNASGMPFHLDLAAEINAGTLAGPRLLTTGPILNSHGANEQLNHQFVATEEEARAAVRWQHAAGFRHIKVYSNLTHEAWAGIRAEAAALGMTVMGHTPEGVRVSGVPVDHPFDMGFDQFLDADFVTIEHVESIVWHGLRNRHDPAAARALAQRIAASGTPVDPTLVAFRNLLHVAETKGAYLRRPGSEWMNPMLVATEQPVYDRWTNEAVEPNRAAFEFYKQMTKMMADAGVLMVAGSDAGIFTNIPGGSLIDELELLAEAGLSPAEVLRMATLNPAQVLGEDAARGTVAQGMAADLVLTGADPLQGFATLRRPALVVAAGRLYDRAALDALLTEAAHQDLSRTQANVIAGLKAQGNDVRALTGG
jgi:uncharacterized protein YciI